MSKLERTEEEKKKSIDVKWFMKDIIQLMILENFKKYVVLVTILELILLIFIRGGCRVSKSSSDI